MKIILTISVFGLFFVSGLKAQNRVAGRIDSSGSVTYTTHFNHAQPTPANNTIVETPAAPADTFRVQPATRPYRPVSPADKIRLEKYMIEQRKNSKEENR